MNHLKTFEGLFDFFKSKPTDPKEIRISLDEKAFSDLCDNAFVTHDGDKILIKKDKFEDLICGEVVEINHSGKHYKIALSDIGLNRILNYSSDSIYY